MGNVKRVFVEKKKEFNTEAGIILKDIKENLGINSVKNLRILSRYDISGLTDGEFFDAVKKVLSEPPVDDVHFNELELGESEYLFGIEYLPGQYDQRGDSAAQAIQIITLKKRPIVRTARFFVFKGSPTTGELDRIKDYLINPVDSREATLTVPESLERKFIKPEKIETIVTFRTMTDRELEEFRIIKGLAMSTEDLLFIKDYFRNEEKRDPTITEIMILDTYWSDHCRHTTFETKIENVEIGDGYFNKPLIEGFKVMKDSFGNVYKGKEKDLTLMSIATLSMKELRKNGLLDDLEVSGEINACSIQRDVVVDGKNEKWLIMFKNETHNHPTEIEPFGGAATCLGGAIRDPLSGRSYVYQAMRVTGSGDPRKNVSETIPGKLPQRKITTEAARGYSSYGNQIGIATGCVNEIYDRGYEAKRMEVGAVIGAVPKGNVVRKEPEIGDIILMIGGRTGRDGIGGATGSSKEHDENSILTAGAEVQKGNPPEERKLQRLFRNPKFTKLIKKSNDFGAGGVSVAIGELASGLEISLDNVRKKYDGLDGTELALSESQERMAVVVDPEDEKIVIELAQSENLEIVRIAKVTDENRLKMYWQGDLIVDISREFLDSNGVMQSTDIKVKSPVQKENYFDTGDLGNETGERSLKGKWINLLKELNSGSQKGLNERFDSTVGAGTVLMPFGGEFGLTEIEAMAAKVPVLQGETTTSTLMSFGFDPGISKWSPFHGGYFSVIEAVSKIVASGGSTDNIRTSLQEYFEKLGKDPVKWGKPFSALVGAFCAHKHLGIAAIGGKDSMSGSFMDLNVPPTLITFAVNTVDVKDIISPELKQTGNRVFLFRCKRDEFEMPDTEHLIKGYKIINREIKNGNIVSAATVGKGGLAFTVTKMCSGNKKGFCFEGSFETINMFSPDYGSIVFEVTAGFNSESVDCTLLGEVTESPVIEVTGTKIDLDELINVRRSVLEGIFPTLTDKKNGSPEIGIYKERGKVRPPSKFGKPKVVIPVFPGTNCEYDTGRAFENAGGDVQIEVFNNLTPENIQNSIKILADSINGSQIIALPGGFSAGDEPDGSGKFIAAVFRNPRIKESVRDLLDNRGGLILGICNGFQALIKLGLVPYGEIRDLNGKSPTLTFNSIGRHVSTMVNTKVVSVLSPWFLLSKPGEIRTIPVSHGEGRFSADEDFIKKLEINGQIATQYVDNKGDATYDIEFNPNGSDYAVEGITSPDGRVLGKMGHSERVTSNTFKNIPGNKFQRIFESGIKYFK